MFRRRDFTRHVKTRQDLFAEAKSFFQQWHAGKDKGIHARLLIGLQRADDSIRRTDNRRSRPGPNKTDAGPEVGRDFKIAQVLRLLPAMHCRHALLADGIRLADETLVCSNRVRIHTAIEIGGGGPGLFIRITHDDIKADAVFQLAAELFRGRLDQIDLSTNLVRRFTP
ncbi:hypothetical protein D3C86_1459910 [compost metagenome]